MIKIRGFGVPFWLKIRGKSENRDFVKIVLPPRRELDFQGSDPPKIDLESRRTTFAAKIDEKALPGTAFWGKSRFLVIFGLPGGNQKCPKVEKDAKNFRSDRPWRLPKFHQVPFWASGRLRLRKRCAPELQKWVPEPSGTQKNSPSMNACRKTPMHKTRGGGAPPQGAFN